MKKYTFISELSPADVFRRIGIYAKPAKGWITEVNCFFYRIYGDNRFWMFNVGPYGTSAAPPFCGSISVDEPSGKTVITGRFTQTPGGWKFTFAFTLLAPIGILLAFGFHYIDMALLFWVVGLALAFLLFCVIAPALGRKEIKAVVAFIERYLLK